MQVDELSVLLLQFISASPVAEDHPQTSHYSPANSPLVTVRGCREGSENGKQDETRSVVCSLFLAALVEAET